MLDSTIKELDTKLCLTPEEIDSYHGIKTLQRLATKTAEDAGWHRNPDTGEPTPKDFPKAIALMHSELSEALECDRKGLMDEKLPHRDGREVELADLLLRIMNTAGRWGFDVAGAAIEKNRYNARRPDHQIANRAAAGGKRY